MGTDRFTYVDVSSDVNAPRYVQVSSERTGEIPLEFVGHAMSQLADMGFVSEIRRTPERDAFVSFSSVHFECADCSTMLEDGTIITTSTAPPLRSFTLLAIVVEQHPSLCIFKGICFTRSIARLLERHRERVARISSQRGSAIVPCKTMREYFAIRLRSSDVRAVQLRIGRSNVVPSVLFTAVFAIAIAYALEYGDALGMVLIAVAALPLIWIYSYVALPMLYRFAIRAPLPERASRLLERARAMPRGVVPPGTSW